MRDFVDVMIVGAGLSGIGAAMHLQRRCPDRSFALLEMRENIGGTWDLFRYPGIRSDSDMYTLGYRYRPWTDGKAIADGPSIRRYVKAAADDHDITGKIRFQHKLLSANWDSSTARWTLNVQTPDGETQLECNFLLMCSGYYSYDEGYLPDFPGYDTFKGDVLHPQFWDEDYDYSGKNVVIIGSGATAVTLVPSMADKAGHVTMLQRSPTYIAARPGEDKTANFLNRILPDKLAYSLIRLKNIAYSMYVFQMAKAFPKTVKKKLIEMVKEEAGEDVDVETHFTPTYNPWDQRLCLAPDGDFFKALKSGEASVVTDHIETFTEDGIKLKSGEKLKADLIVPATGLKLKIMGGASFTVDGRTPEMSEQYSYRGMMLTGMPNFALAYGYTNASWTLKIDLTCERVCRMLNHMSKNGYDYCIVPHPGDVGEQPLLNLNSGYITRVAHELPKQGLKSPWRTYQNYVKDVLTIRYGRLKDGAMEFRKADETPAHENADIQVAAQ